MGALASPISAGVLNPLSGTMVLTIASFMDTVSLSRSLVRTLGLEVCNSDLKDWWSLVAT